MTAFEVGESPCVFTALIVDVGATVVDVGAVGVPVTAFEVGESPSPFTALIVTEKVAPLASPLMTNGLVVVAGFSAPKLVPSMEYL